jgi:hypothetical protein
MWRRKQDRYCFDAGVKKIRFNEQPLQLCSILSRGLHKNPVSAN